MSGALDVLSVAFAGVLCLVAVIAILAYAFDRLTERAENSALRIVKRPVEGRQEERR